MYPGDPESISLWSWIVLIVCALLAAFRSRRRQQKGAVQDGDEQ